MPFLRFCYHHEQAGVDWKILTPVILPALSRFNVQQSISTWVIIFVRREYLFNWGRFWQKPCLECMNRNANAIMKKSQKIILKIKHDYDQGKRDRVILFSYAWLHRVLRTQFDTAFKTWQLNITLPNFSVQCVFVRPYI